MEDYDDDYYDDYDPLAGPSKAFCDNYEVHVPHNYRAINGNHYDCPGFDQDDYDYFEALANAAPCEHGMSAHLCSGPNHY